MGTRPRAAGRAAWSHRPPSALPLPLPVGLSPEPAFLGNKSRKRAVSQAVAWGQEMPIWTDCSDLSPGGRPGDRKGVGEGGLRKSRAAPCRCE